MKTKLLTIGEFSKISETHIKSLRYYDQIGVLKPAYIDPNTKYRYYTFQQYGILEAIKTCIELNIPLKEFSSFTEDSGNVIHVSKLLEQGKTIANDKINSIREGIKNIEMLQHEIELCKDILNQPGPLISDFPSKKYYVLSYEGETNTTTYNNGYLTLLNGANQAGHKVGYEMGKMFIYNNKSIKQFNFVEITSSIKGKSKNVITIPEGHCISKCIITSRIQYAPEEFPDQFAMNYEKIVIETELFTEDINIENPVYQLSCFLPN